MFGKGQLVRVFGVLPNSWILGEILETEIGSAIVLIKDWNGIKNGTIVSVSDSQIEEILERVG